MATINRYTIQGSIVVDQRPLTPPTPRCQVTITGGYLDDDPAKTAGSYIEGSSVTITATPPAGKQFSHFVIEGGSSISSSPATIIVTRNMTVTAMFDDAIAWSIPSIEGNFTAVEDAPFDIAKGLSCGLTGKYTVTFTEVTPPQANDTYDIYAGLDYATKRGPGSLTTTGTYSAIDISLSVSRAGKWSFKGQITCEGFDTPVPIDITIN